MPVGILALCLLSIAMLRHWAKPSKGRGLPPLPGPPGEPLLGHLRVMPLEKPWVTFAQWSKDYSSDVLAFRLLHQNLVVLNSVSAAEELLSRRGINYSDRPQMVLLNDVMGLRDAKVMAFMPWGPTWRRHRRIMQQYILKGQSRLPHYHRGHLERELVLLLRRFADHSTGSATEGMQKFSISVMLGFTYGLRVLTDDNPFLQNTYRLSDFNAELGPVGATAADFFPWLRFLPSWLADRHLRSARNSRKYIIAAWSEPFRALKSSKEVTPCMLQDVLDDRNNQLRRGITPEMTEHELNGMVGTVNVAGQDTVWASLTIWTYCMVMNPDVQAKAREALDDVVGRDRLPTLDDRPKLPYIDCLVQETLRWFPALPLGLAHKSIQEDEYAGCRVPAGSVVLFNTYAMTHDTNLYRDPDVFEPERFLPVESGGRAEPHPVGPFGFGRRICPGRLVAEATMWTVMANLLSTMKIEKQIDDEGNPITPKPHFLRGSAHSMKDFPCKIVPRDQKSVELIRSLRIAE